MIPASAFAVQDAKGAFALHHFERRQPTADDVLVRIQYCGICHTDIHFAHNDFGITQYPLVPGHEIVGVVEKIGDQVSEFKVGDLVGVGYMVDSCRQCQACVKGFEQFCEKGASLTYGSTEQDKKTRTQGGYSNLIVAKQHFVFKIPEKLKAAEVGPLMCAGISTYSPLRKYRMGKGSKVAIVGLGGLGHMAIKFAVALGADVTVLSTSESKREDATRLGAQHFIISKDQEKMNAVQKTFNMVLDTVSAEHDVNALLSLLAFEGVYCILGIQTKAMPIAALNVIRNARVMCGSVVGGVQETREMLQFCADHQISCDVEMIDQVTPAALATAYERTLKADVKYRFVIDLQKAFASTAQ